MFRITRFAVAATVAMLCLPVGYASSLDTSSPAFNGTSLAGWHSEGDGKWSVSRGEIVGSAGSTGGWLKLDRGYEDFMVRFSFQCHNNCETGVLFRDAKSAQGTSGIYISLAGSSIGAVSTVTLDAQGKEVSRKLIGTPNGQSNHPVELKLKSDGWNTVELFVRGNIIEGAVNESRLRPFTIGDAKFGEASPYGATALRIGGDANAEVRIKDIKFEDLTQRDALPVEITSPQFHEHRVTDLFYSEGIAAGDFNHDGVQDIVAGPYYYPGPDYKIAREIYPPSTTNPSTKNEGTYTDSFLQYVYDFNGDGWPDVLKINFGGAYLYLNPRGEARHWDMYKVVSNVAAETTQLGDVDGDGKPELIMSQGRDPNNQISYAKPDWSDTTKTWTLHLVSEKGAWGPHGMGIGDVNGDGRMDILHSSGWWEQPPAGDAGLWKYHPVPEFGGGPGTAMERPFAGGADMYVYDVNGDGLPDVVTSLGSHGAGLAWLEQQKAGGEITWKLHLIMGNPVASTAERKDWEETDKSVAFTELHAVSLVDMDGDGLKDIITGKRWWSHGDNYGSPDAQAAPVMYWFKLVRKPNKQVEFVPHLINNNSGLGVQILVTDVNGDGKPDVLTTARKGTFVFINNIPKH